MGLIKGLEKYPKEITKTRMNVEGAAIGILSKDMLLIDDTTLSVSSFKTYEGRIFFKVLSDIRKQGYTVLDDVTVLSALSDDIQEKLEDVGGIEALRNLADIVDTRNTDSILDALHRENLIMKLYDKGFPVTVKTKDDNGKEYIPVNRFRKMSSEDIISYYEVELSKDSVGYKTKILSQGRLIMTPEYITSIMTGESMGVPFNVANVDVNGNDETVYPYLSNGIKGFMRGRVNVLGAYSSVGKTAYWTGVIVSLIEQGEKVLIFSNEQDRAAFLDNFVVWIAYKHFRYYNISKAKNKSGDLSKEDSDMLNRIMEYYNERYADNIEFVELPSMDIETIKSQIKYFALQEGFSVVLIDTLKMDYNDGIENASRHKLISQIEAIHAGCRRYNLIGLCSYQLAPSTLGKLFLDVTCLSEAKALKDSCENLFMMRIVYPQELIKSDKNFCKPFQRKKKNDKWIEEPYETDPKKIYRMFFWDKCRCGQNSGDSGIAQLLEFDALHCVFKEVAFCRPKRGIIV